MEQWYFGGQTLTQPTNKVEFKLYHWFLLLLERFLASNPLADLMGLETDFRMIVPDPENPSVMKETVCKPDIAIIHHDNIVVYRCMGWG